MGAGRVSDIICDGRLDVSYKEALLLFSVVIGG